MVTFTINIHQYTPNVSIYTSTMDPVGIANDQFRGSSGYSLTFVYTSNVLLNRSPWNPHEIPMKSPWNPHLRWWNPYEISRFPQGAPGFPRPHRRQRLWCWPHCCWAKRRRRRSARRTSALVGSALRHGIFLPLETGEVCAGIHLFCVFLWGFIICKGIHDGILALKKRHLLELTMIELLINRILWFFHHFGITYWSIGDLSIDYGNCLGIFLLGFKRQQWGLPWGHEC